MQWGDGMTKQNAMIQLMGKYKVVFALLLLIIVGSFISPFFLTANNLLNVLRQVSIVGIISVGMTFVVLTGGIDLSVGPILAFASIFVALLSGAPGIVAVVVALVVGFLVGSFNGFIVTRFSVHPFIVTLGMMSVLRGVGLTITRGSPVLGTPSSISWIGQGRLFDVFPVQALILIIVTILAYIILKYTPLGRYTYAIGGNAEASMLSGISVKGYTTLVYGISGLLAGLAGILMATQLNIGAATIGDSMELDAIAAVVIGGTSLKGGVGSVGGTIIGVLIIGILSNLMNLANVPGYSQNIVKGAIIVGAAVLQVVQNRK